MFKDPFTPKMKKSNPFGRGLDLGLGPKSNNKPKRESVAKSQKNEVLARQKNNCAICTNPLDMRATHFDHIKEVYKNGKSTVSNLQALCAICHNIKTHKDKLKKTEKKKSQARKKEDSPFGGSMIGISPKQKKSKSPFDFGF